MAWTIDEFSAELSELEPEVQEKALEIARRLHQQQGMTREEAIREGIRQAGQWFYDMEG